MASRYYFFRNLLLLVPIGVLISGWILYYTEYGEQLVGLLSLGGLFSWLAFVSRVLPEDRVKELQTLLDDRFLSRSSLFYGLLLFLVAAVVFGTFRGGVQVISQESSLSRTVQMAPVGSTTDPETLAAGGSLRSTFTTSYFSPRQIRVKVSGYPDKRLILFPWRRETLYVGNSFLRPVLLLVPDPGVHDNSHNNSKEIVITLTNGNSSKSYGPFSYSGEALWLGCDEDVLVPDRLQNQWRAQLAAQSHNSMFYDLVYPKAVPGGPEELVPGTKVSVTVRAPVTKEPLGSADTVVQPLQTFPQEVKISEPQT